VTAVPDSTSTVTVTRTHSHWGAYDIAVRDGRIEQVIPFGEDPDPSPIGQSFLDGIDHPSRVLRPSVRQGWLERGPEGHGGGRGAEPFVEVSWEEALSLAAGELTRVRERHGNEAIYAGSYGWSSAGRFHHAKSQLQRFLNGFGGFTTSVNDYSFAAAQVILPHVFGLDLYSILHASTAWPVVAEHTELMVAFGGVPVKNAQVNSGGVGRHLARQWLEACRDAGIEMVNVSPVSSDTETFLGAQWLPIRPNTDTALMLALAHTLYVEDLHDTEFLERYCVGFERFLPYLTGESDGRAKDAAWAATICDISTGSITELARRMADRRTMINLAWAIQRGDHGEQPYWMAAVLAAMLGQIGLPGGGVTYGYNAVAGTGAPIRRLHGPSVPLGENPTGSFIPVARISDMLLDPGGSYDYDGQERIYPDIRLVYWCGGNPFHHHQDLNRLVTAWQHPETIIVHEPWWTATARHADIVFPANTTLERNDIGRARSDDWMFPMHRAVDPVGESRPDFDIFAPLAAKLGFEDRFTEGRDEEEWLRVLYDDLRKEAAAEHVELPDFDEFWSGDGIRLTLDDSDRIMFAEFRDDPEGRPLPTPSGRIEIFSETIDSFGYDDCPAHPVWLEPVEWLGAPSSHPLHLISNQPATRLHSQLDCGTTSRSGKVGGREPVTVNPTDAAARGIADGDVVRVFNDRGECLAGAVVSDVVMPGVVVLATGAWYDPEAPGGLDRHGNPNVLTLDKGTSKLGQGPSAHTTLVEIERLDRTPPRVEVFDAPVIVRAGDSTSRRS
jgi:biotin/methionine sulfoxide reductase